MPLPASQQHALDVIDDVLQSADTRLATMFGVFTDLTRLEAMPATETLPPSRWWTRLRRPGQPYRAHRPRSQHPGRGGRRLGRIVLLPVLLLAAVSLVVVSLVSAGPTRRGCGQAAVAVVAARLRTARAAAATSGITTAGFAAESCRPASPQPRAGSK